MPLASSPTPTGRWSCSRVATGSVAGCGPRAVWISGPAGSGATNRWSPSWWPTLQRRRSPRTSTAMPWSRTTTASDAWTGTRSMLHRGGSPGGCRPWPSTCSTPFPHMWSDAPKPVVSISRSAVGLEVRSTTATWTVNRRDRRGATGHCGPCHRLRPAPRPRRSAHRRAHAGVDGQHGQGRSPLRAAVLARPWVGRRRVQPGRSDAGDPRHERADGRSGGTVRLRAAPGRPLPPPRRRHRRSAHRPVR